MQLFREIRLVAQYLYVIRTCNQLSQLSLEKFIAFFFLCAFLQMCMYESLYMYAAQCDIYMANLWFYIFAVSGL